MSTRTVSTTSPGCCCPMVDCDCACCPGGYWTQYIVTVTGIVNNPPPDCNCANYNGTFTLDYIGMCTWASGPVIVGGCSGDPDGWTLSCSVDIWVLGNAFMGVNVYSSDPDPDFCLNGGDVTGGPAAVPCQNFAGPFTLSVTPAGVWVPC